MNSTSWLVSRPAPTRRLRVYCFAYAGGSAASFLPWQNMLPPEIEICAIQLPGRGVRFSEPPYVTMAPLIEKLATLIPAQDRLPFVFFGHSLGGLIAFELARYSLRHGLPLPRRLIVSGAEAPQHRPPPKGIHKLDGDALIAALREYNGTPPELLEHRELMALISPTLRADFALVENYQYQPGAPLDMPLTVFAGKQDSHIEPQQVECWAKESTGAFKVRWFEGDHFFLNSETDAVLAALQDEVASLL